MAVVVAAEVPASDVTASEAAIVAVLTDEGISSAVAKCHVKISSELLRKPMVLASRGTLAALRQYWE